MSEGTPGTAAHEGILGRIWACDLTPLTSILRELQVGIPVTDEAGQRLGHSVTAAKQGIFQVVISRICMAIPAMGEAGVVGWGTGGAGRKGYSSSGALRTLEATPGGSGRNVKKDSPSLGSRLPWH